MGRRALRKIDPALNLSAHFYELDSLSSPLDVAKWFGRDLPVEVEVGSGKGLFLAAACRQFPDRNFLGIEIGRKYAQFAAARLAKAVLTNGRVLHGDALRFFRDMLPAFSLSAIHVYFPDPWWKARHKKRRVLNAQFLRDVERVLQPGGALHFWTDVEEYFQTTLALIAEATNLQGPLPVAEAAPAHDLDYRTHFERRVRLQGGNVYRAEFRKVESSQAQQLS